MSENKDGGIQVNKDGMNCLFCRCKRNTYHKESITTTENNKVVVNVVEYRSSIKFGKGRYRLTAEYLKQMPRHKWEALNFVARDGAKIGK